MTQSVTTENGTKNISSIQTKFTAEQVLTKLLGLIRNTKSIRDFTPEYLNEMMGVNFLTHHPGLHAYGEQLTPDWWYGMQMQDSVTTQKIRRFDLSFGSAPGTSPPMGRYVN